jgi:hypothetical protein
MRARWMGVLLATAVLVPMQAPAARADDFAPVVHSFRRISPDVVGSNGTVEIEVSASDEGAAGLDYIQFYFSSPFHKQVVIATDRLKRSAGGTFIATGPVGIWAASGAYQLYSVYIYDVEGNSTTYYREDAAHAALFDFDAAAFNVDNPLQDITAPTIKSVRLFRNTVLQGMPVVALYEGSDDLSGIHQVGIYATSPSGLQVELQALPNLAAVGPAYWLVPLEAPSGEYDVNRIIVWDKAFNVTWYDEVEGTSYSGSENGPSASPSFEGLDFTVEGSVGDRIAPTLHSLSMLTPSVRHPEDEIALDYTATDTGSGIRWAHAWWIDESGTHQIYAGKECGVRTHGPMAGYIEDYRTLNTNWKLQKVRLVDYLWNTATYTRDGTVVYEGDPGPANHDLDFSLADFRIEAGEASDWEYFGNNLVCYDSGLVSLEIPDPLVVIGEFVESLGEVTISGSPLPDAVVAVHRYVEGVPHLVSVEETDGSGQYETGFVAREDTAVQATFFGYAGPNGSPMVTSDKVEVEVLDAQEPEAEPTEPTEPEGPLVEQYVQAQLKRSWIRLGRYAKVKTSVTPWFSDNQAILQRRTGSGWVTADLVSLSADGQFLLRYLPSRKGRYVFRVVVPEGESNLESTSPLLRLWVQRA